MSPCVYLLNVVNVLCTACLSIVIFSALCRSDLSWLPEHLTALTLRHDATSNTSLRGWTTALSNWPGGDLRSLDLFIAPVDQEHVVTFQMALKAGGWQLSGARKGCMFTSLTLQEPHPLAFASGSTARHP